MRHNSALFKKGLLWFNLNGSLNQIDTSLLDIYLTFHLIFYLVQLKPLWIML